MKSLALALIVFAQPALAFDACDDLWFTRNLVFDRAGYCFGSPLGRAVFDDGDCTTTTPVLLAADRALIAVVKANEREFECQVDTARNSLDLPGRKLRHEMVTLPVRDVFESACFGWLKPEVPLFDGVHGAGRQIGVVRTGDDINFSHGFEAPFSFVTVYRDEVFQALGWGVFPFEDSACEAAAG